MSKCDEEPCKSALAAYNALILDGMDIESWIAAECGALRDFTRVGRWLFAIWAGIWGTALLCLLLHPGMAFCEALFAVALAILMLLVLLFLAVVVRTQRLARLRPRCRDINRRLREAYTAVERDCPEECWPKELAQFKCDC